MNCHIYELSCLWIVMSMNCHVYELSYLWIFMSMNCHVYELSFLWIVISMNCHVYELSCLWIVLSMNICLWNFMSKQVLMIFDVQNIFFWARCKTSIYWKERRIIWRRNFVFEKLLMSKRYFKIERHFVYFVQCLSILLPFLCSQNLPSFLIQRSPPIRKKGWNFSQL